MVNHDRNFKMTVFKCPDANCDEC